MPRRHAETMPNLFRPLADATHEAEAQEYAKSYDCSIEEARRDVLIEWNATDTDVDNFIDRVDDNEFADFEAARAEY